MTKVEKIEVIPNGENRWLVPSSTDPGVTYGLALEGGIFSCNCPAGERGKYCKHKKAVFEVERNAELGKEKQLVKNDSTGLTKSGYAFDEVASALQKDIRRGYEESALFWAMELYETAPSYTWKRLLIIAAEDIGLADPEVIVKVTALAQAWEICKRYSWYVDPQHVVMAVLVLARAPKSTEVDDAKNLMLERRKGGLQPPIPEYAVDVHTKRGKEAGKTVEDWYQDRNATIPGNKYRDKLEVWQ